MDRADERDQTRPVTLTLERYAREVLPATIGLWGAGRDLATYRADLARQVASPYLARQPRFTIGLLEDDGIAASCKVYERDLRWTTPAATRTLRARGIGAVFTPPAMRGRGHARRLLSALIDDERRAGADLAYLYSDIDPSFYEALGFVALPSRLVTLRLAPAARHGSEPPVSAIGARDWSGVRACFDRAASEAPWHLTRSAAVWDFVRTTWEAEDRAAASAGRSVRLLSRGASGIAAYVIGRRVPAQGAFVLDDFGWAGDAGRERLASLLRHAAGDLTRVAGWLPPLVAREVPGRGSVRRRTSAILMVAPLSRAGGRWCDAARAVRHGDAFWAADHV